MAKFDCYSKGDALAEIKRIDHQISKLDEKICELNDKMDTLLIKRELLSKIAEEITET